MHWSVVPLFVLGFLFLIKGGDWFVDGATIIAHKFHIPEILIGATVVSIGTTLPEVMVSVTSAMGGNGSLAYGNAIGSIICNSALIAALTIAIRPSAADRSTLKTPVIFFFVSAVFYALIAYISGEFTRVTGYILLGIFAVYMIVTVIKMKKDPGDEAGASEGKTADNALPLKSSERGKKETIKAVIWLVLGAAAIAIGARLLVDNATIIAKHIGVPDSVIGLTLVALGTSLPELVTAITALVKGHSSMSLGNIIGANIFNIVLVSGAATAISPFKIPQTLLANGMNSSLVIDIPVMLTAMLILTVPALIRQKLSRAQGISLLLIYVAFCVVQFVM